MPSENYSYIFSAPDDAHPSASSGTNMCQKKQKKTDLYILFIS